MSIYEYDEEKHLRMEREAARADGRAEGVIEGENRINQLILKLSKFNRTEDIVKAAADVEYQKKLLEEFQL